MARLMFRRSSFAVKLVSVALIDRPRDRVEASVVLNRLGRGYTRMAAERSIGLDLGVAADLRISGSDEMLEVTAENLLGNAIDFSPPAGGSSWTCGRKAAWPCCGCGTTAPACPKASWSAS